MPLDTSRRYGIQVLRVGSDLLAGEGWFVHVFVDHATRKPAELTPSSRTALWTLQTGAQT